MYVRLPISVFKTLVSSRDIDIPRLRQLSVTISNQQKLEELVVTISNAKSKMSKPMEDRLVNWYKKAPLRREFNLTSNMVTNLVQLGLVNLNTLREKYQIRYEQEHYLRGNLWMPLVIWYFTTPESSESLAATTPWNSGSEEQAEQSQG